MKEKELYIFVGILSLICSIIFARYYPYLGLVFIIMMALVLIIKAKFKSRLLVLKIFLIIFIIIFTCLVLGIGKYKMITVTSGSMEPNIYRGDAIILRKVNSYNEIEKNMVVAYQKDNSFIIHRVINIEEVDGVYIFKTKGDNNETIDDYMIPIDDIYGIMVYKIPYIGYPSIWFREKIIENITKK